MPILRSLLPVSLPWVSLVLGLGVLLLETLSAAAQTPATGSAQSPLPPRPRVNALAISAPVHVDGVLDEDDSVILLLDTFHDHRNAYWFETNANGARTDALVTDEGRNFNVQWDGVWDVAARRTHQGWTAEIAIPFASLRFDPNLDTWGFNVRRLIRYKGEEVYWASMPLEG